MRGSVQPHLDVYGYVATQLQGDDTMTSKPEKHISKRAHSLALAAALAASAAGADPAVLTGPEWVLFELDGRASLDEEPPSLTFLGDGRVSAYGGCNRFNGGVDLAEGEMRFPGPMAGTMMACPPERMTLEQDFINRLPDIRSYRQDGALLELSTGDGALVMRLRQKPIED